MTSKKRVKKHKCVYNKDFWGRKIGNLKETILVRFCNCGERKP